MRGLLNSSLSDCFHSMYEVLDFFQASLAVKEKEAIKRVKI